MSHPRSLKGTQWEACHLPPSEPGLASPAATRSIADITTDPPFPLKDGLVVRLHCVGIVRMMVWTCALPHGKNRPLPLW